MKSFKSDDLALKSPTKAQRVSLSLCLLTSSAIDGEYSTQPLESVALRAIRTKRGYWLHVNGGQGGSIENVSSRKFQILVVLSWHFVTPLEVKWSVPYMNIIKWYCIIGIIILKSSQIIIRYNEIVQIGWPCIKGTKSIVIIQNLKFIFYLIESFGWKYPLFSDVRCRTHVSTSC
jgi:hypothetical protein